jgi:hypothetical protein
MVGGNVEGAYSETAILGLREAWQIFGYFSSKGAVIW